MGHWPAVQATVFLAGSAPLVWVSRRPLRAPGSHGFYRFFAWEAILALCALNLPVWFRHPFSLAQLASWLLLTGSAFLVLHAARLFQRVGRPGTRPRPADPGDAAAANYEFENTSRLVQVGAYRFIRHPMYASLLYLGWGVYLKQPGSWLGQGLALATSLCLWLTARADERESLRVFGSEYVEYMQRTRRFVPFVW
jgi:hypothetical protein